MPPDDQVEEEEEEREEYEEEEFEPSVDDDGEFPSENYEHLQIEPIPEGSSVSIELKATNPYGSVKRPLKTVPKSEIAAAHSSSSSQMKHEQTTHDYDSSFDQSADDSGAPDSSAAPPAPKLPRGHLPKQCYVCGLIVTRMRDHMKSHPNELQYKCEHCPKSYLTKTGRDRHMDGQHPEMR